MSTAAWGSWRRSGGSRHRPPDSSLSSLVAEPPRAPPIADLWEQLRLSSRSLSQLCSAASGAGSTCRRADVASGRRAQGARLGQRQDRRASRRTHADCDRALAGRAVKDGRAAASPGAKEEAQAPQKGTSSRLTLQRFFDVPSGRPVARHQSSARSAMAPSCSLPPRSHASSDRQPYIILQLSYHGVTQT